ncbi:hypothetical protein B9Z55_026301 [Caenorhabditis nigoni]|uniref:Uncharacterized protein n=1 Tax=Caenorhabditis nigoni TaxID=1611254 RepID=A0A2G5T2Q0_9PELO|nr:hypothetical protein B9Z55_026301 [Caenorhabditis nigoni]
MGSYIRNGVRLERRTTTLEVPKKLKLIAVCRVYKKTGNQLVLEDQKIRTQETPATSNLRYCLNKQLRHLSRQILSVVISKWFPRLKFAGGRVFTVQKRLKRFLENYHFSNGSEPITMIERDDHIRNHWIKESSAMVDNNIYGYCTYGHQVTN